MKRVPDQAPAAPQDGPAAPREDSAGRSRRRVLTTLFVITLLAAALRWPLANEPLWVDELHTSWVVGQGRTQLSANAQAGNQSPLWFYLPWLATRVADLAASAASGDSATNPWLLRLPSLLAGLAVPWLTYAVARRLTGFVSPALFAAALAALDPRFAFYATEARAYATVQVLALTHFLAWLAVRDRRPSSSLQAPRDEAGQPRAGVWRTARPTFGRAAWIGSGGLLFFTHYTTALVFVAEALVDFGILAVTAIRQRRLAPGEAHGPSVREQAVREQAAREQAVREQPAGSQRTRRSLGPPLGACLVDFTLLAAVCLPAVPHLQVVASHRADWGRTLSADDPWTMFDWYALAIAPLAVVAATAAQRAWSGRRPWLRPFELSAAWRVGLWILVPWLAAWAATSLDVAQLLRYRYLIASATLLPLVAALSLASLPRRVAQVVLGVIVLTVVIARHDMIRPWLETSQWPAQRDERWPALVERVDGLLGEKRVPILLFPALVEDHRLKVEERASGDQSVAPATREQLVRFCRFPLEAYAARLPADTPVIPLATLASPRLDRTTLGQLAQRGGGLIVVRGDAALAAYLVRQLSAELSRHGLRLTTAVPEAYGNLQLIAFTARK